MLFIGHGSNGNFNHDSMKSRSEILSRFKEGQERYYKSPMLHCVVNMLTRDADPIEIIDMLVSANDEMVEVHKNYVLNDTRPAVYIMDKYFMKQQ